MSKTGVPQQHEDCVAARSFGIMAKDILSIVQVAHSEIMSESEVDQMPVKAGKLLLYFKIWCLKTHLL